MAVSRRRFIGTSSTIGAAAAAASLLEAPAEQANAALTETATRWAQTPLIQSSVVTPAHCHPTRSSRSAAWAMARAPAMWPLLLR